MSAATTAGKTSRGSFLVHATAVDILSYWHQGGGNIDTQHFVSGGSE